jgi:hypothetical protein
MPASLALRRPRPSRRRATPLLSIITWMSALHRRGRQLPMRCRAVGVVCGGVTTPDRAQPSSPEMRRDGFVAGDETVADLTMLPFLF